MSELRKSGIAILRRIPPLFIFALSYVSPCAMAQTAVDTPRTIRVVMDDDYAPYVFQSDKGKLQGILVDQWQEWEKKTGIKAQIHSMDWSEALRRMRAREFDVIDCIVETAERRDYFDFTPAYNTIEASIYFRNNISGIPDLASLKGFSVGVKAGDQHIDKLKANGVTNIILFQNNEAVIQAAKERTINVFLVDDLSALYLLNKMSMEAEFRHSAPVFRDELRRAVLKGNTTMLNTVSDGFAAIEPGKLKQIHEKWFGKTINIDERYLRYLPYFIYAVAIALLLIAGLTIWNRTLRKKILERTAALSGSEERFRQIAGNIHEVFWLRDTANQKMLYISPAYETIWGRTCESLYKDPGSFIDAIHPDDKARVVELMEGDRKEDEIEYRILQPDGSVRWIWDRAFPVKDESGLIYRVAGIAEDITGRRSAEEELKKEKEILSKIFNNIPMMIGFVGDDGDIKLVNPEWERTMGWTLKELQEQGVDIFAEAYPDPSYHQQVLDFVAASTGEWADLKIKVRNGKVIDAACVVVRLSDGTKVVIAADITGRKQAEDALRRSEDQIRLIIDTIPMMAWSVQPDGSVDFVNQRWLDYAGLSLEEEVKDPTRIVHPLDLERAVGNWFENRAAGASTEDEMRLQRADGEYRWFLIRTAPLHDEQGKVVKWYGVAIDIEDRKRAEDALRESEQRYLSLFENMAEGVVYFKMLFTDGKLQDAIYLEVNRAFENLNGLRNVVGRKITEVLPGILEANSEFIERSARVSLTGQTERFEAYSAHLKKWLSISAYCPKKEHVIVVLDDITERKQAEDKLRLAYQRLSYHVENTPLAIIEWDKDLFIKRWSKRAEEIFGWKESEVIGKNVYDPDFPIIYAEDKSAVDTINEQLTKGTVNRNLSLNRNYTKSGEVIYCEWYNSVLRDKQGNVITILSLVHNVTERKKAEEQKEFERRDKEALINATDDLIWSISRDFKLIAVNKAFVRHLEDLVGVTFGPGDEIPVPDVVPADILAFWREFYSKALSGETFKEETYIPAQNRLAESWWETSFNPIYKDETVVALACYARNITERKIAEEQIKLSEGRLAEAQRLTKLGSWDFDIRTDRLTWSEELYHVFGTDKRTFRETYDSFIDLVDKADRELALQTSRHTRQTGEPFSIEYHITTPKGEKRVIQEYGYGQTDASGKVVRLFGTAQDITERKKDEQELQQLNEALRSLSSHLQNIQENERTAIAREIHDELGQQLTGLKMEVAWLNKKLPDDPLLKGKVNDILSLISDVLQTVKRIAIELRPAILDDLGLMAALEWHGQEFEKRTGINYQFRTDLTDLDPGGNLSTHIFRIYQEALTNVVRHAHATAVETSLEEKDGYIKLIIKDNGQGFDPDEEKNNHSLGLIGMYERTLLLHGELAIESDKLTGTVITLKVPLQGNS